MKVLELFAGTRSIGKAFEKRGHDVFSVEWDRRHGGINLYADIGQLTADEVLVRFGRPDVVWASPDCASYSVAAISHHRDGTRPKTDYARFCDAVNAHALDIIRELKPRFYFIENPAGMLQHMEWLKAFLAETGGQSISSRTASIPTRGRTRTASSGFRGRRERTFSQTTPRWGSRLRAETATRATSPLLAGRGRERRVSSDRWNGAASQTACATTW